jgi:hypothetical protein
MRLEDGRRHDATGAVEVNAASAVPREPPATIKVWLSRERIAL